MAQFKFFLIGTTEAPVLEVPVADLVELGEMATRTRFVVGRMIEINGDGAAIEVLIPTARIQLVAEASS